MPMLPISLDGRELQRVPLTLTRTTVGKPGVAVASIRREGATHTLRQTVGSQPVTLNNQPLRPGSALEAHGAMLLPCSSGSESSTKIASKHRETTRTSRGW